MPFLFMGEASGSVLLASRSAVRRYYHSPFISRCCLPSLQIQSLLEAFSAANCSSVAQGKAASSKWASCAARLAPFGGSVALKCSSKSSSRWASTAKRGAMDSSEALASTLVVASKYSSLPHTNPASRHSSTILSKKRRNTSRP